MPLDHYAPCPCGSGKKLKFCCSDLLGDMEKIQRMLEGDQRSACLEHIRQLETKHPNRASLLGLRSMLEIRLERWDDARATLDRFLENHPRNLIALPDKTQLVCATEGGRAAIDPLQDALEAVEKDFPGRLYQAMLAVARALLTEGELHSGVTHLIFCVSLAGSQDQAALSLLLRINANQEIPLLLRAPPRVQPPPNEAEWKDEMVAALSDSAKGRWRMACKKLEALSERVAEAPLVWRNLGLIRAKLADNSGAVVAIRKCAQLDIPLDDAVELEAFAQLLDNAKGEEIETVSIEYPIADPEKLNETLLSDRRADRLHHDTQDYTDPNTPAPSAIYSLLDRALPRNGAEIQREEIPHVLGSIMVFGRETDRPARLELIAEDDERLASTQAILAEMTGETLGEAGERKVLFKTPKLQRRLRWQWRMPNDMLPERQQELIDCQIRETLLEKWPDLPLPALGGLSVSQFAAKPDGKIPALASILLMELAESAHSTSIDFNILRERLGLPGEGPIDLEGLDAREIPVCRMSRLRLEKVSDDELLKLYEHATFVAAPESVRHICREIIRRGGLGDRLSLSLVYDTLFRFIFDENEESEIIEKGRQAAIDADESPAQWYLTELSIRIEEMNFPEIHRLAQLILDQHGSEEGVGEAVLEMLYSAGLIPDDAPAARPTGSEQPVGVGGAGGIWTPGEQAAASSGQPPKKQTIWTPD